MHEIWQMKSTTEHINAEIVKFVHEEVKCLSFPTLGLANFVLYDIPGFLLLNTRRDHTDCVNLIDDIDSLFIQPSRIHPSFEYNVQTIIILLDEYEIIYTLEKMQANIHRTTRLVIFELLWDLTTQQTGLASSWTIFVYGTEAVVFNPPRLQKIILDQNNLQSTLEPEVFCINTVQGLLPSFNQRSKIGPVQIKQKTIDLLLKKDRDLNDLIINGHLFLTLSTASTKRSCIGTR